MPDATVPRGGDGRVSLSLLRARYIPIPELAGGSPLGTLPSVWRSNLEEEEEEDCLWLSRKSTRVQLCFLKDTKFTCAWEL